MAKKPESKESDKETPKKAASDETSTKPKFPYTTKPGSLRKFFQMVPQKPKPAKVNRAVLKAWEMKDNNDSTIIRVLKALDLVGSGGEPTDNYTTFMTPGQGPGILGAAIKDVWAPLFELSHEPHREPDATLRNYFNIHSGGSESTINYQIQTFKAACEFADFDAEIAAAAQSPRGESENPNFAGVTGGGGAGIHIDLHIHLPENKSRRDYEYMFEDIARDILGRKSAGDDLDGR